MDHNLGILCPYCTAQGIATSRAYALTGKDAVTIYPNTARYGCNNGHRFALPVKKPATRAQETS